MIAGWVSKPPISHGTKQVFGTPHSGGRFERCSAWQVVQDAVKKTHGESDELPALKATGVSDEFVRPSVISRGGSRIFIPRGTYKLYAVVELVWGQV